MKIYNVFVSIKRVGTIEFSIKLKANSEDDCILIIRDLFKNELIELIKTEQ